MAFNSVFNKLRDFEASLAQPLAAQRSTSPSSRVASPALPSITTDAPRSSTDGAATPSSPMRPATPKGSAASDDQSAGQLADQALSSLRASFRNRRTASGSSASSTVEPLVVEKKEAVKEVVQEPVKEGNVEATQSEVEKAEDVPAIVELPVEVSAVVEEPASDNTPAAVEGDAPSTPAVDAPLPPASPDTPFVISTAEATPAGTPRSTTPALPTPVDVPTLPHTSPLSTVTTVEEPSKEPTFEAAVILATTEAGEAPAVASPPPEEEEASLPLPKSKDPRVVEITKAYKRLQALKSTLDRVVKELTPLEGVSDVDAFEGELRNMKSKTELSMSEIGRLSSQLDLQKERMEELRDTHRLESKSQTAQIDSLTSALKPLKDQLARSEETFKLTKAEVVLAQEAHEKTKLVAKEEEEKRIKALSLLRALRQKLVKSEKDMEESNKEREALKVSENAAQETLRGDRARFDQEIVSLRAAQEQQHSKMRNSFDRESTSIRAQNERESLAKKRQYELELITIKAANVKELAGKDTRIQQLEGTIKEITTSRDALFEDLQLRTAEMESSSSHQEALQARVGELQYEARDARDRAAALQEELDQIRKSQRDVTRDETNTRRLLLEAEARHETKVRDMEARARQSEVDRQETEEEMGRNLQDRLKEVERMRQQIVQKDVDYAESIRLQQQRDEKIQVAEAERAALNAKLEGMGTTLADLRDEILKASGAEIAVREELQDRMQRASELEGRLEEVQAKESSLRSNNKILRDELRKLQSGVLLSEKQRNPGVGYFAAYSQPQAQSTPALSNMSTTSSEGSRTPGSISGSTENGKAADNGEEALNFEYLRNVILQFLERPEMRLHLVSVLGVILHFSPAEVRRLASKSA